MSIDESALSGLRSTLEADDYRMAVSESGSSIEVTITAGPDACEECLVPKPLMRNILHAALGVPEDDITLVYPADAS
ncbi:hypothetical protein [Pseudonocardia zijingensis]|uniref:NifU family protein n=1 Tax=Pseudonocardia zijingensis TaxID=153376 RepID=A0ABN1N9V7_9PSEU